MARGSSIAKLATSIVTLPITIAVVLFAVSNRNIVEVQFWPLPGTLDLPLYVIGLVTMVVGFLIGGVIAWLGGAESRHRARMAERDIRSLEIKLSDAQRETEEARAKAAPAKIAAE
ncbi:MAG: LapA family protein [Proteobacteria bacterium]|nr:LapA family protein [Pseudomonadota bacterium]MDA1308515.1 LapA family protein [Pseudomonadota bacterium]